MSRSEMLPRKCCLEYDIKTLGLLLRRPNIALVIVRPFLIEPYKLQRRSYLFLNSRIALSKGTRIEMIFFSR